MQLSKTLFLRRKNINNLSELKQYFSTYYYLRIPGEKENYTKDLDSEELAVFNWMYNKYVKGKFKTLSELFNVSDTTVDFSFPREIKPEQIWNDEKREVIKEAIKKHKQEISNHSPLINNQAFNSTRHKVNPETTTTPHPSFVNNMNVKYEVVSSDNAGENLLFLLLSGEDEKQIFKDLDISEKDIQAAKKDLQSEAPEPLRCQIKQEIKDLEAYKERTKIPYIIRELRKNLVKNPPFHIDSMREAALGKKETEGKLFYEFDWEFIEAAAKRMQNNKGKYEKFNWTKETSTEDLKQALNRHHIEVMKGNYKDGEEELGHVVSYFCNAMMLWHQLRNFPQK